MSPALLGITYAGLALAGALARVRTEAEWVPAARAAWCAAAGGLAAAHLARGWSPAVTAGALGWALALAGWTFSAGLALRTPVWGVGVGALGGGLCALGGGQRGGPVEALGDGLAVGVGVLLAHAMRERWGSRFRLVAYTLSFFGTFCVFLPMLASAGPLGERVLPGTRLGVAALLAAAALPLGLAGARGLVAAGGTPEPLDPPPRLCTAGIYGRIRHPLQLAELLAVAAGSVAVGSAGAGIYGLCFAVGLLGPMRILEERTLLLRHGDAFQRYRAAVPAYWPRVGVLNPRSS